MLTTTALHHPDLDQAIGELLSNARQLALAGLATEANAALSLLLQPGPWRLPAHGAQVHQVQRLLPPVCWLAGQPCPAFGELEAMAPEQVAGWTEEAAADQVRSMARVSRNQMRPAGADWSPDFLSTLAERCGADGDPRPHVAFGQFCMDAEFVLKARIGQRFGCSTATVDAPSADELRDLGLPEEELAQLLAQLQGAGQIDVAPAAEATPTLDIARATVAYLRTTGFAGGYLASFIFLACWLLLVEEGQDSAAQEVATDWLAREADAPAAMLDVAAVASVARFLRSGRLAAALQVDAQAAQTWLATLASRQPAVAAPASLLPEALPVPQTLEALLACVQGTHLQALPWLHVPVPGSPEHAWVASVPVAERKALWRAARALVGGTGCWPLVTTLWTPLDNRPDVERLGEDLFMRFPYGGGAGRDDITPQAFIAGSQSVDVDGFLAELAANAYPPTDEPEAADDAPDPAVYRQPPFDPDNAWLVLLPTPHGENALAYEHWYGLERGRVEGFIALLRRWRERYGAELFAHYGTMLEFVVTQPPADLDAALALTREHALAAPCTLDLSGTAQRHHALGLVGHGDWFLHERP